MSTTFWVLLGTAIVLFGLLMALALCRAAARGDQKTEEAGTE
jgi:hypothetical protein